MKQLQLLAFLLSFSAQALDAQHLIVTADIKEVTVFTEGAQVNRMVSVKVPAGFQEILIEDLPVNMDQSTIYVKPLLSKVRSVQYSINRHEPDSHQLVAGKKDSLLYLQIEEIKSNNSLLEMKLEIIAQELDFIKANRLVTTALSDFSEIKNMNEYYRSRLDSLLKDRWNLQSLIASNEAGTKQIQKRINEKSDLNVFPDHGPNHAGK